MPSHGAGLAFLAVVCAVAVLLQGCGKGTSVAPTWTATFTGVSPMFSKLGYGNQSTFKFVFDLPHDKFYFAMDMSMPGVNSSKPMLENRFAKSGGNVWEMTKFGFCAPQDMDWASVRYTYGFGWLADAVKKGEKTVNNVSCVVWTLEHADKYSWSACLDNSGVPREYSIVVSPSEAGSTLAPFLSMVNLTETSSGTSVDTGDLDQSEECKAWPPAPCDETVAKPAQIFRLCETCFDNPSDENAGDFSGMLSTICSSAVGGGFISGSDHIVRYDMVLNSSYGPYQMFNYIPNRHASIGSKGIGNLVGKSIMNNVCSVFPTLDNCGQCTDNPEGNWFSFPAAGRCAAGKPVGAGGCTWNVTSYAMKNMSCVAQPVKGPCEVYTAATQQPKPDFPKIQKAVEDIVKALATAMGPQSAGGCPDVPLNRQMVVQI